MHTICANPRLVIIKRAWINPYRSSAACSMISPWLGLSSRSSSAVGKREQPQCVDIAHTVKFNMMSCQGRWSNTPAIPVLYDQLCLSKFKPEHSPKAARHTWGYVISRHAITKLHCSYIINISTWYNYPFCTSAACGVHIQLAADFFVVHILDFFLANDLHLLLCPTSFPMSSSVSNEIQPFNELKMLFTHFWQSFMFQRKQKKMVQS